MTTKPQLNAVDAGPDIGDAVAVQAPTAKDLRSQVFAKASKPQRLPFTFNGVPMEFVQPNIAKMYGSERSSAEGKSFIVFAMIENAYAPGTNEKIFTPEDYDAIMEMPIGAEMSKITKLVTEMFGLNVEEEAKN